MSTLSEADVQLRSRTTGSIGELFNSIRALVSAAVLVEATAFLPGCESGSILVSY